VANLIRERKTFQIQSIVQTSKRLGMATMNDALLELVETRQVELAEAYTHAADKANFLVALRAKGYDVSSLENDIGPARTSGPVRAV
jgi:twitching motility protein PilT